MAQSYKSIGSDFNGSLRRYSAAPLAVDLTLADRHDRAHSPERRLLAAVLVSGITEALAPRATYQTTACDIRRARRWIRFPTIGRVSFYAACGFVGLDPLRTHTAVTRRLRSSR
jgi:hypothetical protein